MWLCCVFCFVMCGSVVRMGCCCIGCSGGYVNDVVRILLLFMVLMLLIWCFLMMRCILFWCVVVCWGVLVSCCYWY